MKMKEGMNLKAIIFGLLFVTTAPIFGQEDFLRGKLLDAETEEPVVFASIRIKNRTLGVISNLDGSFRVPQRYKALGDTLQVSSMGYIKKDVLISELSSDKINIIELAPRVIALEETVVEAKKKRKNYSARAIVKKAIEALHDNYPMGSFSTVGYYRDYQYKDGVYINLNEAILEIFDQGFDQTDSQLLKLGSTTIDKTTIFFAIQHPQRSMITKL